MNENKNSKSKLRICKQLSIFAVEYGVKFTLNFDKFTNRKQINHEYFIIFTKMELHKSMCDWGRSFESGIFFRLISPCTLLELYLPS